MPKSCGQAVYSLWVALGQTSRVLRSHFSHTRAWVQNPQTNPRLSKFCTQLFTQVLDIFTPVNAQLSALCTAPITTITIK